MNIWFLSRWLLRPLFAIAAAGSFLTAAEPPPYTSTTRIPGSQFPSNQANAYLDEYRHQDAYFEVRIDFKNKTGGNPEVIWETGSSDVGFSLLYLPGNKLGLYLDTEAGGAGPELMAEATIPQHLVDRVPNPSDPADDAHYIVVDWTVDFRGPQSGAVALWVDHEQVAMAAGAINQSRWTGSGTHAGIGQAYNQSPVGGVPLSYFPGATAFDNFTSYESIDPVAGLRFWAKKHIVSDLADADRIMAPWEAVRDAQVLRSQSAAPRFLRKNAADEVLFDTSAPAPTHYGSQWRVVPIAPGSEWFYLINEASGPALKGAYVRTSPNDGKVLCTEIGTIANPVTAHWKWNGPAPAIGQPVAFQHLLSRYIADGDRRLTTSSADSRAYALTGIADLSPDALWTKHHYVTTTRTYEGPNPTITGAVMPFITLQAEAGALNGAANIIGDYRGDGDTDDVAAGTTAAEALGRRAVKLGLDGSVDIALPASATNINFMALRYSLPDDFPNQVEHAVTIQVKRSGASTFQNLKVKEVNRWMAAEDPNHEDPRQNQGHFKAGPPTSHYKLFLNTRLIWTYWRYANFRSRITEVPMDNPDPLAIDPTGNHACELLRHRNAKDANDNGRLDDDPTVTGWLTPLVNRRFAEVRCFLDATSLTGSPQYLQPGDIIRIKKTAADTTAAYVIVDAVDLESVAGPASMPANFISITDSAFVTPAVANDDINDDAAFDAAILRVHNGQNAGVWIPAGFFRLGKVLEFPYGYNITIRGAGMAHTVVFGPNSGPANPIPADAGGFRNFGFNATEGGATLVLNDITLLGDGVQRSDGGKAIGGAFGPGTDIQRVYFQGMGLAYRTTQLAVGWEKIEYGIDQTKDYFQPHARSHGVTIRHCRVRDLSAGGIIVVAGSHNVLVEHCHVRGAADDSLSIASSFDAPGKNGRGFPVTGVVMRNCTAEAGIRGNGFAFYGGYHNRMENIIATDTFRAGITVATAFDPIPFGKYENQMTYVSDFLLLRCGKQDSPSPDPDPVNHPSWRPGLETIHGALVIEDYTYGTPVWGPSGPEYDECLNPEGSTGTTFHSANVANVLLQGGIIAGARNSDSPTPQLTNDGVIFYSERFGYSPSLEPDCPPPYFTNVILSNFTIRDVPPDDPDAGVFAAVHTEAKDQSASEGLHGGVIVNNIAFANIGAGSKKLEQAPGSALSFVTSETGVNWNPNP